MQRCFLVLILVGSLFAIDSAGTPSQYSLMGFPNARQTSSAGDYSLAGGFNFGSGQALVSGPYSLCGDFTAPLLSVSIDGSPTLSVFPAGENILVTWSPKLPGYRLQFKSDLASGYWITIGTGDGASSLQPTGNAGYFRLATE